MNKKVKLTKNIAAVSKGPMMERDRIATKLFERVMWEVLFLNPLPSRSPLGAKSTLFVD